MHNGHGHGNGKRWIFIVLLILGAFWLVNDSYQDGYTDALVQTGQAGNVRYYRGGPDFPWGLLILGGLGYIAWRKGAFDRFGGPGGPFGSSQGNGDGQRGVQRYGPGSGYAPSPQHQQSPQWGVFRGPRAVFDEWHREAHQQGASQPPAPPAPPVPPVQTPGNGAEHGGFSAPPASAPAPAPPAPEYWASMTPPDAPPAPPQAQEPGGPGAGETPRGATGPVLERW